MPRRPYVVLAGNRADNAKTGWLAAAVVGLLAAIGIGIKPHFVALALCVETWLLLHTRQPRRLLRVEVATIVAVGVIYLAAVGVFAPAYYLRVVPDALSNYGGFKAPWDDFAKSMIVYLAFPLCGSAMALSIEGGRGISQPARAALCAALGFALAAAVQQKGWPYQFYPVAFFLVVAAAFILNRKGLARATIDPRAAAAVFLISLAVSYHTVLFVKAGYSPYGPTANVRALTESFARHAAPNESVFAFITSPRDVHPAVLASGRQWAGKSGVLMYLPAAINMRDDATNSPHATQIMTVAERHNRSLIARLVRSRPAVIAFDDRHAKLGIRDPSFDYLDYFARFSCFRRLMTEYVQERSVAGFRIFRKRNRVDAGGSAGKGSTAKCYPPSRWPQGEK